MPAETFTETKLTDWDTRIGSAHRYFHFRQLQLGNPSDSGFDYQVANVAKNAPRWIKVLKPYGYWPQVATTT